MFNQPLKYGDLNDLSIKTKVPLLELQIILTEILKIDKFLLAAYPENIVDPEYSKKFYELLNQRINKIPLAYIINKVSFWDLDLFVNSEVLVPRSTTELLVEQVLSILTINSNAKILELGTGSGAISLAIAKHRPMVKIIATDFSKNALEVAKINAKNLAIKNIQFLYSDWFEHEYFRNFPKFDIIISNPPYIAETEKNYCDPEVFFEPKMALFSKDQGLDCLYKIVSNSPNYLIKDSFLILEHGFKQKIAVITMLQNVGFSKISAFKDLAGLDRVVVGKF